MSNLDDADLTKLSNDELLNIINQIQKEAYDKCKPLMSELSKRYQQHKHENEQKLKKAS